jgi:uncharacterized glyoxalase superfamily protein PhnB
VLGWTPFRVVDGVAAFFQVGTLVLSLCAYDELCADVSQTLNTTPPLGVTLALNVPDAQAVDALFAALRAQGTAIVKEPARASWGGYSGYFADPEGYRWEIAFNPEWHFDPADD